jgi:hypothetical protein
MAQTLATGIIRSSLRPTPDANEYGIVLHDSKDADAPRARVERLLRHAQELEAKTPFGQWLLN